MFANTFISLVRSNLFVRSRFSKWFENYSFETSFITTNYHTQT